MEADQRHRFGNNDTVVVCWTDVMREDWYSVRWQTPGNIINNKFYTKEYIAQITERGALIEDLAQIKAAKIFLESKPTVNWKFISMCEVTCSNLWADNPIAASDVMDLYKDVINTILPSYKQMLRPLGWGGPYPGWCEQNRNGDPHPNPAEHLEYLDSVLPGWVTKQETRAKMLEETALLEQNKYKLENHRPRRSGLSTVQRL